MNRLILVKFIDAPRVFAFATLVYDVLVIAAIPAEPQIFRAARAAALLRTPIAPRAIEQIAPAIVPPIRLNPT